MLICVRQSRHKLIPFLKNLFMFDPYLYLHTYVEWPCARSNPIGWRPNRYLKHGWRDLTVLSSKIMKSCNFIDSAKNKNHIRWNPYNLNFLVAGLLPKDDKQT